MLKSGRRTPMGKVQAGPKGPVPDPETHPWWFHPGRLGTVLGPPRFREKLHELDPDLEVTWHPVYQRWCIWMKRPTMQNRICWGWALLFNVPAEQGLDERVLARLYSASTKKWGSAKHYFDSVQRELEAAKAAEERQSLQDTLDSSMESWDHSRIRVGYGPSNGSKFSDYHS